MAFHFYRFGDRKDGRRIRSIAPLNQFIPYIMKFRNESTNYYEESFKIDEVDALLHELRLEGYKGIGLMHFTIASYVRALAKLPGLNRYIAGRRIFARHKIEVAMMVKREMSLEGDETAIKVEFEPTDTLLDVYRKMDAEISNIKTNKESNSAELLTAFFCSLPRLILQSAITILKFADYFDLIPSSILKASPFHASLMITNLGSLGILPVFHHLYNFGTLPAFVSFGVKRRIFEMNSKGEVEANQYIDYKFSLDERIADGIYFASFLREFKKPFHSPRALLVPPERIEQDVR